MICLAAATGAVLAWLGTDALTLAWTHSVEKTSWEEDWRLGPSGLEIVAARVQGSGAGMEPPPSAVLRNGTYTWRPQVPALTEVVLRRSGATADWRLCFSGEPCRTLGSYLPSDADPVLMKACPDRP